MNRLADLIYQARHLRALPRSGYQFLGNGKETVAEHTFTTSFIAYVMTGMDATVNGERLLSMCLLHDLPEARVGDLNLFQKEYVRADEDKAVADTIRGVPFGGAMAELIKEFHDGTSREACLARDADQLAFAVELKVLSDRGYATADKWLAHVRERLKTELGKALLEAMADRAEDAWWFDELTRSRTPDGPDSQGG